MSIKNINLVDNNILAQSERLRILLNNEDLMQKELAEMIGLSWQYMSALINGKKKLSFKMAKSIENATGYRATWLLKGEGTPKITEDQNEEIKNLRNSFSPLANELKKQKEEVINEICQLLLEDNYIQEKLANFADEKLLKYAVESLKVGHEQLQIEMENLEEAIFHAAQEELELRSQKLDIDLNSPHGRMWCSLSSNLKRLEKEKESLENTKNREVKKIILEIKKHKREIKKLDKEIHK